MVKFLSGDKSGREMTNEELKEIQIECEATSEEMAESLAVSLSLFEKWRSGKRAIQPYHERAIMNQYGWAVHQIKLKKRK